MGPKAGIIFNKYASQHGLLSDLKGALDTLRAEGIRIGDKIYREVLGL
ncbi:MAG TPA: DUF3368 domain-containing protein [Anaerolineae bacterium]|nr:DUF3368 domain-containing protein [Anaerolineae bacterium]